MADAEKVLIAAASFEDRSTVWVRKFLDSGGRPEHVFVADIFESYTMYEENLDQLVRLGICNVTQVDRFSSRSLWEWTWSVIEKCSSGCDLVIDVTCMPRELLGMLLFAVSVKRLAIGSVSVAYVAAPEGGYATQNKNLPKSERWLSKGVTTVRSIIDFPGIFRSEKLSENP